MCIQVRSVLRTAVAVAALALLAMGGSATAQARDALPDLDQAAPHRLAVVRRESRVLVVFGSAVDNVGAGPLEVRSTRASTDVPEMQAEQVVLRSDGSRTTHPLPSTVRYVESETHQHWHLLGFQRYELWTAGRARRLRRDRKTGFCLGDRYETDSLVDLPGEPPQPSYAFHCGEQQPERLDVLQGISVGYGDNYPPLLEGQSLDVTSLRSGRYLLVHRANPDRVMRESNYRNNAASVLIELRRRGGRRLPRLRVLAVCPGSDRCRVATARS